MPLRSGHYATALWLPCHCALVIVPLRSGYYTHTAQPAHSHCPLITPTLSTQHPCYSPTCVQGALRLRLFPQETGAQFMQAYNAVLELTPTGNTTRQPCGTTCAPTHWRTSLNRRRGSIQNLLNGPAKAGRSVCPLVQSALAAMSAKMLELKSKMLECSAAIDRLKAQKSQCSSQNAALPSASPKIDRDMDKVAEELRQAAAMHSTGMCIVLHGLDQSSTPWVLNFLFEKVVQHGIGVHLICVVMESNIGADTLPYSTKDGGLLVCTGG